MKNLTVYTALIILLISALISPSEYLNAQELNLVVEQTYFGSIAGPPGTTLDVMLINENDTIRHSKVFPENGAIVISNALTGINDNNYTPSNKDIIDVFGNNLFYSPKSDGSKGINDNYVVNVFNVKGEFVSSLPYQKNNGYITAHFDGNGVSDGKYFFQVIDGNKAKAKGFLFDKDNSSNVIPNSIFEEMNKQKVSNEEKQEVSNENSKFKGIVEAHFTYTPDVNGPDAYQHDKVTFVENIDVASSGVTNYTPYHDLPTLEQILNAKFQVANMHTGDVVSDANVRILNGEKEVIGYVTPDSEGKFTVENLPCDSTFYAQVSHPTLRNMEYDFFVPERTRFVQESEHPYVGIIPGDGVHKIALAVEPGNFVGKSEGLDINNPALTIDRVLEGQIPLGFDNIDGLVPRDYVMGDKVKVYNPSDMQLTSMETFATKILGGTSINDYFTIVDTPRDPPNANEYNYLTGDVNAGINWLGETENKTITWEKNMYDNNGKLFSNVCIGGDSKSTNPISSVHELMWYLYTDCVFSEESPINSTAGNIGINDPLSVQYRMDVNEAKYKNGFYTGECSDLYLDVEEFKSSLFNGSSILKIK